MKSAVLSLLLLAGTAQAVELPFARDRAVWNKPLKPFHVIGNIYYVGLAGVSSFLIATPQGDILTDGALAESAPLIERNIQALGFKLSDVKIILNSHAHYDHAGGLAQLKRDTGAVLYAGARDVPVLQSGHIAYGPASRADAPPVQVDHPVQDGDTVSLGGVTLTAHATPGHTQGCTTWTMPVDGKTAMFFCSISVAGNPLVNNTAYPDIVADYRASFAKLAKLKVDIFFAAHGEQFGLAGKMAKIKPGSPNPFVDPGEKDRFLAAARADFDRQLARQKAAKP